MADSISHPPRMAKAIFLDRDGTLIRDGTHASEPAEMTFLPGVAAALRAFASAGYRLVVVSNQSGVARAYYDAEEARTAGLRIAALMAAEGLALDGYYFAPQHLDGIVPELRAPSLLRKPGPGMLLRAAADLGLDLDRSWMVGDYPSDVGAAQSAGCRAILLDTGGPGYGGLDAMPAELRASGLAIARNLAHAAAIALGLDREDEAWRPLSVELLVRPKPSAAEPATGEPSPWPDAARMKRAEADGQRLARA